LYDRFISTSSSNIEAKPCKNFLEQPVALKDHHTSSTLILALGNHLRGDDGIGSAIIETLAKTESLPSDVILIDGGIAGLKTLLLMQDYRQVIIVDAAQIGCAPGGWVRFSADELEIQSTGVGTYWALHSIGLAGVLSVGKVLGILPPEVVIYGVQPKEIGWSPGFSEPVQKVIPIICENILEELDRISGSITNDPQYFIKRMQSDGKDTNRRR
jgi:hydrogenase maturation protease